MVTVEECSYDIHNMKINKWVGLGGLTVEFYGCQTTEWNGLIKIDNWS